MNVTFPVNALTATENSDGTVDLLGKQGCTWELTINLFTDILKTIPMTMTNYSARGQIKEAYGNLTNLGILNCSVGTYTVTLSLTATNTAAIPYETTRGVVTPYYYDVEVYTGTPEIVTRILQGKLTLDPEVTT